MFGGFGIYRFENNAWVQLDGGATRIAVNPIGMPWVVNDAGQIFARDGNAWINTPDQTATDIGVGLDDTAWITTRTAAGGGFTIAYWIGTWRTIDGGATNIAVDHDGLPWGTNSSNQVFQRVAPE